MNAIVRASLMAMVLAPAWLTPTPSLASECRIGPVAVEAPACNIVQGNHPEGPAQYAEWNEGGFIHTVIVIAPDKPRSFRGYFTRWRYGHKCSVKEVPFGHEVRFTGQEGRTEWHAAATDLDRGMYHPPPFHRPGDWPQAAGGGIACDGHARRDGRA